MIIKGIVSFLSLLYVLLVGTPTPNKSRILNRKLTPKEKRGYYKVKINLWIERNFNFIALAAILILIIFVILFSFWAYGVSAVESGTVYNHLNDVI